MIGYEDHDVSTLSGGEAQRIPSRAHSPTSRKSCCSMSPPPPSTISSKQEIEHLLASPVRERNMTCVWVTHDVAQARRVSDLVLRLEAGPGRRLWVPHRICCMLNLLFHTQMSLGLGQAVAVAVLAIIVAQFASRRGAKIGREIPLVLLRGMSRFCSSAF